MRRLTLFALLLAPLAAPVGAQTAGGAPSPQVFDVVDVPPHLVGGLAALAGAVVYPEAARRGDVQGTVVVQFVVDEAGAVQDAVVMRSPDDRLSGAALDAVRQQRFTPGRIEGRPVKVRFAVPVTFRLADPEPAQDADSGALLTAPLRVVMPSSRDTVMVPDTITVRETAPVLVDGLRGLLMHVEYPEQARRRGIQGVVVVEITVAPSGEVTKSTVLSSPHDLLSQSALNAVRRVRFEPARRGGQPVEATLSLPVTFRLR